MPRRGEIVPAAVSIRALIEQAVAHPKFQSAPRSCDRGDAWGRGGSEGVFHVSIRAPVLRPGRRFRLHRLARFSHCFNPRPGLATGATACRYVSFVPMEFQSAPRSCDRGDTQTSSVAPVLLSFNPRPGLATGATRCSRFSLRALARFNPRPGLATGATAPEVRHFKLKKVSIRAPVLRPGRLRKFFSSAAPGACFNPRPGLATGATYAPARILLRNIVFQSAPRSCDRGDEFSTTSMFRFALFQSAPRSCDRGDLTMLPTTMPTMMFQSAPRSCDRGDLECAERGGSFADGFNPRPGLATGAT